MKAGHPRMAAGACLELADILISESPGAGRRSGSVILSV